MLRINMILKEVQDEDSEFRVLWFDQLEDIVVTINIHDKKQPRLQSLRLLEEEIAEGHICVLKRDPYILLDIEEYSSEDFEKRDEKWKLIEKIVDHEPEIYSSKTRIQMVRQISMENEVEPSRITWVLLKFWKRGMNRNALLTRYKVKKKSELPRRGDRYVDDRVKKIFKTALNKYYYQKRGNLTSAYHLMVKDYFSDIHIDEDGNETIVVQESIPSIRQFRYFYSKNNDIRKEISTKEGAINYQLKDRPLLGSDSEYSYGPGHFQIDASVLDVYIISDYSIDGEQKIIGRPVMYNVVDVYSRMIIGYSLGINDPSWEEASLALLCAFTSKIELCKNLGIEIEDEEWKYGIPNTILADKGEFEGFNPNNLVSLGIKIQNTSSKRGDMKSLTEGIFNQVNNYLLEPFVDGYVDPHRNPRISQDYRINANLSLSQLNRIIVRYILFYNKHHYLKSYDPDSAMLSEGVKMVPNAIWDYGIRKYGRLKVIDENLLINSLMQRGKALITEKGIKFKGLFYVCEHAIKMNWFGQSRTKGSWKVDIVFDSRNVETIYIKAQNGQRYEKCRLVDYQNNYSGMSSYEVESVRSEIRQNAKDYEKEEIQKRVELYGEIEAIIDEARTFKKSSSNAKTKSARIREIKGNREIEKAIINENCYLGIPDNIEKKEGLVINLRPESKEGNESDIDILRKVQKKKQQR